MENKKHLSPNLKKVVQILSHNGILSEQNLQKTFQKICGYDNNVNFLKYIHEINSALNEVDLTVKSSTCELTGQKYWVLSSTVLNDSDDEDEDQPNKRKNVIPSQSSQNPHTNDDDHDEDNNLMLSSFTKPQMELFRLICEEIILFPTHCIPSNNCINLVGSMKGKMVRSEAERFLKQATQGLWFIMKDGQVYLGPRSIAELMPFFKVTYDVGLTSCPVCSQVTFYGHTCVQCDSRTHYYCLFNLLKFDRPLECLRCKGQLDVDRDYLAAYSSQPENNNPSHNSQSENTNVSQRSRRAKRGEH